MMAKFSIIFTVLLSLIFNSHVSMSVMTIDPLKLVHVPESIPSCSSFLIDTVACAPFLSDEQSQPGELCCSVLQSVVSRGNGRCFCDVFGELNVFMALSTICQVTVSCEVNVSPASSPVDAPGPNGPVSCVPSPAPENERPAVSPLMPSPDPQRLAPSPLVPSPEPLSPTSFPSAPSPKPLPDQYPPPPSPSSTSQPKESHPLALILFSLFLFSEYFTCL